MLVPPKTKKSERRIAVDGIVIDALREHKKAELKMINRLGDDFYNKDFIYTNADKHPEYPIVPIILENRMARLLKLTELNPNLPPHCGINILRCLPRLVWDRNKSWIVLVTRMMIPLATYTYTLPKK